MAKAKDDLLATAIRIRDAVEPEANTAELVGGWMVDMVEWVASMQSTTYTGTYTTTAADWVAKCGAGTSGAAVTASATGSTQGAADAAAKTAALAGITCAVFTTTPQSYTVTQADIDAKCGSGTTAMQVIQRSNTTATGNTQAAANAAGLAAATAAAKAAIVCTVPPVTYTYNLSDGQAALGVSNTTGGANTIVRFNAFAANNNVGFPAMLCFVGGVQVTSIEFPPAATGQPLAVTYNDTTYTRGNGAPLTFIDGSVNLS